MDQIKKPTKEHIRQWLRERYLNPGPLPEMEQIRFELGWRSQEPRKTQTHVKEDPQAGKSARIPMEPCSIAVDFVF